MNSKFKIHHFDYGLALALLLPLFAVMPLLTKAGLPNTADGPVHLMRQVELNRAWQEGNFYPRWGADLALGHGMPIFSYAPPLLYHLTQLFHLTGLPLDESMKAVVVVDFLLYSGGMFLFARRIFGPAPALAAAALHVYAPYRLREAYIQGNYGQFTGLAFYPLICWAFHGLITTGRTRYLPAAAVSLAGLLLSHNISSMIFLPLFAVYLLVLLLGNSSVSKFSSGGVGAAATEGDRREYGRRASGPFRSRLAAAGRAGAAALLGLGLAAIFWLPAFGERDQIKLEGITRGFFDFRENFISLPEFLSPPLPLDLAAINPEFPLSLGLPQVIAAGLGMASLLWLLSGKTAPPSDSPATTNSPFVAPRLLHTLFFTLFLLLYAFLALPYSQPAWEAVPLLELAEFPWRMLGPAVFCAGFLAAPAVSMIAELLTMKKIKLFMANLFIVHCSLSIVHCSLFIALALNAYYLYPSQFIPWGTPTPADAFHYEVVSGAIGTTSTGEFLPRAAQQHPHPDALWPDY
ncbi:MAG: glycosyltransferase family 39 protein, partial [Chloroflexota bacterium]